MPNTHLALNEKKEAAIAERCLLWERCIRFLLSASNFGANAPTAAGTRQSVTYTGEVQVNLNKLNWYQSAATYSEQ